MGNVVYLASADASPGEASGTDHGPDFHGLPRQIESAIAEMLLSSRLLTREAEGLFRLLDLVEQAIDLLPDPEARRPLSAWVLSSRDELLQNMHALSEQIQTRCGPDRR